MVVTYTKRLEHCWNNSKFGIDALKGARATFEKWWNCEEIGLNERIDFYLAKSEVCGTVRNLFGEDKFDRRYERAMKYADELIGDLKKARRAKFLEQNSAR